MNVQQHKDVTAKAQRYLALDADAVTRELDDLFAAYPELADDEDLRADMVEGSTNAFELLERIVSRRQDAKSMQVGIGARIDDLKARSDRYERQQDAMEKLAFKVLKATGLDKVPLTEATVSIAKTPARVEILDEAALPEWAFRVSKTPNKTEIGDALKGGKEVPGAVMSAPGERLNVRVK